MFYAGLDVSKRRLCLAVVDERSGTARQGKAEGSPEGLLGALAGLGRGSGWPRGHQGLGVGPGPPLGPGAGGDPCPSLQDKGDSLARIKSDRLDAHILAQLLRADLVARAYVADKETRALRGLLRYRAFLVGLERAVKNRIHALLDRLLVRPPMATPFSRKGLEWLAGLQLPEPYGQELAGLLRLLSALRQELELVAGRVREAARRDERAILLTTVPGLGYYLALLVLAEIGDVSRFPTARHLASYAGLVPSTYASGGVVRHGAITKQGSRFLRWALVEAAMHAVRRPGPLQEFYRRLLVGKGAQKARVAVARKLAKAVFWMLKTGRSYKEVEPYLAPQGQASSSLYMA